MAVDRRRPGDRLQLLTIRRVERARIKEEPQLDDETEVLRPSVLFVLLVCTFAFAGGAFAHRPVFVVVSGGGHGSLSQAIRFQLAADRRALSDSRRTMGVHSALLRRSQAAAIRAADPFPAEDRAVRLEQVLAEDAGRVGRLRRAIRGLELALSPVALPEAFLSQSSSTIGAYAASIAERYLGVRYVWGGGDPSSGFDCSGFVKYVYAQLGIQLPHYAASQYATTKHIDASQLQPGDLVFFEPRADGPGHVGMYLGNDVVITAPHTGDVVKLVQISTESSLMGFVGASRPAV